MTDMSGGNPTERSNMVSNAALLDDLDRQIVHELQRDGRRAFRDIGRHLGVPEATVRSRVRRMQENRSLRIIGLVDPRALGGNLLATLLLKVRPRDHDDAITSVCSWPEALYVSTCLGRANLMVQVICESTESLYDLITERVSSLEGVVEIETLTEVRLHKAEYIYPEL